jgi:excisionase family DNA binding protein
MGDSGKPASNGISSTLDALLTLDEVCAVLKLDRTTIYQMTYRKQIPYYKIANRLRFRLSEILEWIANHRVASAESRGGR